MLPYFYLIVPIAVMASMKPLRRPGPVSWGLAFSAIVIFVGLRHHVGMDWNNYLIMIQRANIGDFWNAFNRAEPGYTLLLRISGQMGWGIYGTYLMGTLIFAAGLFRYAKTTPSPWMALLVAIPFLVVVTAMAAARQTVAIGVLFWVVADWNNSSLTKKVAIILLASMFHTSAVIFLLFAFLDIKSHWMIKLLGTVVVGAVTFYFLEGSGQVEYYDSLYGGGQTSVTQSSGAIFHVMLNGGPALLAVFAGNRVRKVLIPKGIHQYMALTAIFMIPMAFVMSVAAGRITLYLFPVSMWIFASLPGLFATSDRTLIRSLQAGFFVGLLAFWLSFANTAFVYTNYQNALLVPTHQLRLCCR